MIIESKYDLQETISRLQSNIYQSEDKSFMPLGESSNQKYKGTVSDDGFRLFDGSVRKPLTIVGRIYEENSKVYILFKPRPDINHVLFLILCAVSIAIFLIMLEWQGILGVIFLSGIISGFELSRLHNQYNDFKDFISALLK